MRRLPSAVLRGHGFPVEVVLVLTGVVTYFGVRGQTHARPDVAVAHALRLVDLERALHVGVEHSVQALVVDSDLLTDLANWVYIWGHWPVIAATLLWLHARHRTVYLRLRNAMAVSGGLGLLVFTTYPVAPPRLAGLGLVDTVTEQSHAYRVLQPPQFVDQYAALPSLHVGWDLLVGLAVVAAAGHLALRVVGAAMPLLMAFAVVATANHYVVDVVAGVAFALTGHAVALLVERRRTAAPPPLALPRPREAVEDRPAPERLCS